MTATTADDVSAYLRHRDDAGHFLAKSLTVDDDTVIDVPYQGDAGDEREDRHDD